MHNSLALISYMLLVPEILPSYREHVRAEIWTDPTHRQLVKAILDLYDASRRTPDQVTMKEYLAAKHQGTLAKHLDGMVDSLYNREIRELEIICTDDFQDVITRRACVDALEAMASCIEHGDIERANKIWARAVSPGVGGAGYDYFNEERIKERTSPEAVLYNRRGLVKTGYPSLDRITKGGAGAGELWAIAGRSNRGKSRLVLNMAVKALYAGKKVLYVTLEMAEEVVVGRADQIILGASAEDCLGEEAQRALLERFKVLQNKGARFIVKQFPEYSIKMRDLEAYVMRMPEHPDLIITDYLDLVLPEGDSGQYWENQKLMFAEARRAANRLSCAHWTVIQPKNLEEGDLITGEKLAGSYGKMNTLDGGWSLHGTDEEESRGEFSLYGFKNRYGPRGKFVKMRVEGETLRVHEAPLVNRGRREEEEEEEGEQAN